MTKLAFSALLLATAALAGCKVDLGPGWDDNGGQPIEGMSPGMQNRAFFGYDCTDECGSLQTAALAAGGAHAFIVAATQGEPFDIVLSSDPTVAVFTLSGSIIDVQTGHAGQTTLSLLRRDGSLLDSAQVTVHDTATLALPGGLVGHDGPVVMLAATMFDFHVTTLDGDNQITYGTGSVLFTASSDAVSGGNGLDGDDFVFSGQPGDGSIVATATSATAELDAQFVTLADLTSLDATVAEGAQSGQFIVEVTANSDAGPVYGVPCTWRLSGGETVKQQQQSTLAGPPPEVTEFAVTGSHASATCQVGNLSTVVAFPST